MINPPKRAGYRLTYDAELMYNDWQDMGGCTCLISPPCSSCTHEGHPISLEENDEAWEEDLIEYTVFGHEFGDVICVDGKNVASGYCVESCPYFSKLEEIHQGTKIYCKLTEEMEMSRSEITDKSNPPKSEWCSESPPGSLRSPWFGFKYRVTPETSKLLQEAVFKDGGSWAGGQTHVLYLDEVFIQVESNGKMWRGFNSFESIDEPEKQPPQVELSQSSYTDPYKHTAYVKFRGYSGKYDSKEYCYKCDDSVLSTYDSRALIQYASVNVSGEIKTVQIQRISKDYVDSKATKCIIGIVEEEKGLCKEIPLHVNTIPCTLGLGDIQPLVSLEDVQEWVRKDGELTYKLAMEAQSKAIAYWASSLNKEMVNNGNNATTNVGDVNMTQVTRKVYSVQLIDGDAGLPVELSLVHDFKTVITEDDIETTKQQLLADIDLAKILKDHNAKRTAQVNLDIQNRTGNSVKLLPITKVKELTWSFK